jgi:hypothetical protein
LHRRTFGLLHGLFHSVEQLLLGWNFVSQRIDAELSATRDNRERLVELMSQTGGHLADHANPTDVCQLVSVALHFVVHAFSFTNFLGELPCPFRDPCFNSIVCFL